MDELFNSGMIIMLSNQIDNLTKELDKYKENQLTVEEIDYLIRRESFTKRHATITKVIKRCESIINKLQKQKEILENEER